MPHVEVGGIRLWADIEGEGPPVVLLHGFTGTAGTWRPFAAATGGRYRTIAFDHIGHGESDAPAKLEHYRMDQVVDDLVAAVRALGHERASWVGYSMGGRTALQVVCRHPAAVSALVLEGASPGIASADEREARVAADERLAQLVENEGIEGFVDYWQSIPLWDTQQDTLTDGQRQALREQRMAQRPVG
ncbi:MAG: alpha/beta fold hydrolase, partial [Chloroflexi bacterium]|nr:alpha/beta fold hydrolase [Chloroflexota bacterium]